MSESSNKDTYVPVTCIFGVVEMHATTVKLNAPISEAIKEINSRRKRAAASYDIRTMRGDLIGPDYPVTEEITVLLTPSRKRKRKRKGSQ